MAQSEISNPAVSIIIARVSAIDGSRIFETLDALQQQDGDVSFEIILADRINDANSREIQGRHPEVHLIECPTGTSIPRMRTIALNASRGSLIAITEDHCVPATDWLRGLVQAFADAPPDTMAVGGSIANGVDGSAFDRATFLCEYAAFQAPVIEGPCGDLPGMNIAYRRSALQAVDQNILQTGFWESTLHPAFLSAGQALYSTNRIKIQHRKTFCLQSFLRQRFLYSRHFAGSRAAGQTLPQRLAMLCLSILLPPLLGGRLLRTLWVKRTSGAGTLSTLPYLSIFVMTAVCGELAGQLAGPGDALSRIE